jgi:hypothetical protein
VAESPGGRRSYTRAGRHKCVELKKRFANCIAGRSRGNEGGSARHHAVGAGTGRKAGRPDQSQRKPLGPKQDVLHTGQENEQML